jgi:hypothetical protein
VTSSDRSRIAELMLSRLAEVLERLRRVEQQLAEMSEGLDTIDRTLRPYGDGRRLPWRARRG